MSGRSREAQLAWVSRVLNYQLGDDAGPDAPPVGVVEYRKALLGFRAAVAQVNGQLGSFSDRLAEALPDEAELANQLAHEVNATCEKLYDRIDSGIGAPVEGRTGENEKIQRAIIGLIAQVKANKLIAHLDDNPIMPLSIAATLTDALTRVAETIV